MRFVKTAEEIEQTRALYARCQFLNTRVLTVYFETSPDAVRALLPPPLEPSKEPLATAWVSEVGESNCIGPFLEAALGVQARYGDLIGNYIVTMAASTPEAVTFGRELYGEPKKHAKIIFEQQDEFVWGSAERHGKRLISLRGRMDETAPNDRRETSSFFFKFAHAPDGNGFDSPPRLVHVTGDVKVTTVRRGRGEIIFRDSPYDPVYDIPVVQVLEALYTEGHSYTTGRVLCDVDPEPFAPYALSRNDPYELLAQNSFLHAQASRRSGNGRGRRRAGDAG